MLGVGRTRSLWLRTAGLALAVAVCGCGSSDSDASPPQRFAVLSAFPAELAPHIERAAVTETMIMDNHVFRVGTLDGVPVVLALTGIGLVNAATTTRLLLDRFPVDGIVVSAVAGSSQLPIADVAVPVTWVTIDGTRYAAQPQWVALAGELAALGSVSLERCTPVPSHSEPVCVPGEPAMVVGGIGRSSDPFGDQAFRCRVGGDDVFGCDVALVPTPTASPVARQAIAAVAATEADMPVVDDMETAAIAREAAARGVPFIAFRAVSDGPGDPLGLPNFLEQFNAYYRLAARNAAAATVAFLERIAPSAQRPGAR
jgi:nucleoside phosphorylase